MAKQPLFDRLDARIEHGREEGNYAYFRALGLKLEYVTKIVTSGIVACVADDPDRHRYSLEHQLVRADSLGDWVKVLNSALVGPPAEIRVSQARILARDLTQRVGPDDWRYAAVKDLAFAANQIGTSVGIGNKVSLRQFFDIATQLRNRSTGHGATTDTQCGNACRSLSNAIESVVRNLTLMKCSWVYIRQNVSQKYRVEPLLNDSSPFNYLKSTRKVRLAEGVYFHVNSATSSGNDHIYVPLIFSDAEVSDIELPNGNFKPTKEPSFESLSYVTNNVTTRDGRRWRDSPSRRAPSLTQGNSELRVYHNVFSNAPKSAAHYIHRNSLESRLERELIDTSKHPIVTLIGPGGIGKTATALTTITKIARSTEVPYDFIIWISARDIDLLDTGPKPVRQQVFKKRDIADFTYRLLEPMDASIKGLDSLGVVERFLANGTVYPTLFIFDNFETIEDPVDVFDWIDCHVRLPNKVLITSRIREFKGDYPINIPRMSEVEARELINSHSRLLRIENLLSSEYVSRLINESDGHPYVIKIFLGQVASDNRLGALKRIVANSDDLLRSLFERTYDMLKVGSQRIFLLLSGRRTFVPEVAVEAVLNHTSSERFDVGSCLEQLHQFSLVDRVQSESDNEWFLGVPFAAFLYGHNMLKTSRFKSSVESDQRLLWELSTTRKGDVQRGVYPRVESLIRSCIEESKTSPTRFNDLLPVLEFLADKVPRTYLRLADLANQFHDSEEGMYQSQKYTRRYLQSSDIADSYRLEAWNRLAELYRASNDFGGEIHAICEAALLPTSQPSDLGNFARRLNARLSEMKKSGSVDLSSSIVRDNLQNITHHMDKFSDKMSADHCSALAWLFVNAANLERPANVANLERARDVAALGFKKDPQNHHCKNIIEKLES